MRLLHTETLAFEEFSDEDVPKYAILSHRWASVDKEVSYADFKAQIKQSTSGYAKLRRFCKLACERGFEYCWIDTCCIDKTSSAELSEAINSMFFWYERAAVCFAYLPDIPSGGRLAESEWFQRGWTLQELLAPDLVEFFDNGWRSIGTRTRLRRDISSATGLDEALLQGQTQLKDYSVAQKMSWAARRVTSRVEDEAYCLMGIFGVNMPLLYGEGTKAFRRLQEQILANGDDTSLFAWGRSQLDDAIIIRAPSILAPSPKEFESCGDVIKGFATQRILFEVTNCGILISIHRTYNRKVLTELLEYGRTYVDNELPEPLGLTIPLSCYRQVHSRGGSSFQKPIVLELLLDYGKWRRVGIASQKGHGSWVTYSGAHFPAYANDYVRIYTHDDWNSRDLLSNPVVPRSSGRIRFLHLKDNAERNMDF